MRVLNTLICCCFFTAVAHSAWAQADRASLSLGASGRQALATHLAAPDGSKALARLPPAQPIELTFTLKLRNPEQLNDLLKDLYDPGSPAFRHFLTVEAFSERFGPTEDDLNQVLAFASAHELTVTRTAANRMVVTVSGSVKAVEQAFGVQLQVYRHPAEARTFYAPDVEPSLDRVLPIQGMTGLSTLYLPHPASSRRPALSGPAAQLGAGSGPTGSLLGSDLRTAYAPGVSLDGTGQSIGIFSLEAYNLSDVQAYFSSQGQTLTVPIVNVLLDGVNGRLGASSDDTEAALDIEMALSLAPKLSAVFVYEGSTPLDILTRMATDNISRQLSCSYVFAPDPASYEPVFLEFAAQGQSFFASSGDGGAFSPPGCTGNCWNSLFPADDPYVTAVGGTVLATNSPGGAYLSETVWPDSGGGINDFGYPIASYQAPLINATNQGSGTLRNIPDVAAVATNVFLTAMGTQGTGGGTSAATPIWASFMALVNQQANGTPIGFLNPAIYPLAQTAGYTGAFHDITSGNNFNGFSPDLFSACAGYDLATGLGSPNGQALINALSPVTTTANFSLLASSSPITLLQGAQGSVQISLQPANGFAGTVTLSAQVMGTAPGASVSLDPSSISGSTAATLTVTTTGSVASPFLLIGITGKSGSLIQSLFLPVAVQLPNLVTTAVSAPPATIAPGGTFSVTDTTANLGQAPAGASVTQYYLSSTTSLDGILMPVGSRSVPALAAGATSSGTLTATVPSTLWPNTPYYLLACANSTNSVTQAAAGGFIASSTTALYGVATAPTLTTLAVTASGSAATQVAAGTAVTLAAQVSTGSTPMTPGTVQFLDTSATYGTNGSLLGTAQLDTNGKATLRLLPGIGVHAYQAVFAGTNAFASSSSAGSSLTVNGKHASANTLAVSGSAGSYSLTATLLGMGGNAAPSGSISFLDTSNGNGMLGNASLVAGSASLTWQHAQTPATGTDPQGIATGDFNGDGLPDLAVANRNDGTVTILLGKGDGTFTGGTTVTNVPSATALVVGDFNNDGKADLAVINQGWTSVTILLGNGDGTFTQAASSLTTGFLPIWITVGDFNGDGQLDLAVSGLNTIAVFLGKGDGTFTPAPDLTLQGELYGMAQADFNGDGKADLAVAVANPNQSSIAILLGNGDGTFRAAGQSLPVGQYPASLVAADFNGDGRTDLAVAIADTNAIEVFLGKGDGTFAAVGASPSTGNSPAALVVADFNGDGLPDLAVANGDATITVLLGQGNGTFTAASVNLGFNGEPAAIVAGDWNGDGYADLATANAQGNNASVFVAQWQQTATATLNAVDAVGAGNHLVEASYPGDADFTGSVSATVTLAGVTLPPSGLAYAVNPAVYTVGTAITANTPSSSGGAVTAYAVSPALPAGLSLNTSTGAIAGTPTASAALATYTVTATNAAGEATVGLVLTVNAAAINPGSLSPAIALTSSANPCPAPDQVTFTATITGSGATPSGMVTFLDGTTQLGSGTLTSGVATLTTSSLAVGTHAITAAYGGDATYLAATSSALSELISAVAIAPVATSVVSITPGGSSDLDLTITPQTSLSGPITFTTSGLPAGATCTFSVPSLTLSGAPATVKMTITTTSGQAASLGHSNGALPLGGAWALLGCGIFVLPSSRGRKRMGLFLSALLLAVVGGMTACGGGGGGSATTTPASSTATPAGTYPITVTATVQGTVVGETIIQLVVD